MARGASSLFFDRDAINVAMIALIGKQPLEVFCGLLSNVHQRFLDTPDVQGEASFVPEHLIYEQVHLAIEHSLEHPEKLERWAASQFSPMGTAK